MPTAVFRVDGEEVRMPYEQGQPRPTLQQAQSQKHASTQSALLYPFGVKPEEAKKTSGMEAFKREAPALASAAATMLPAVGEAAGVLSPALRFAQAAKGAASGALRFAGRLAPAAERIGLSSLAGRGTAAATGQPQQPWYWGPEIQQLVGEATAVPFQLGINAAGARAALKAHGEAVEAGQRAYEAAVKEAADVFESQRARGRVATEMGQQVQRSREAHYAMALKTYTEAVPARFMKWAHSMVEPFKKFPATLTGLDKVASIEGQHALSEMFDPYLKAVVTKGENESVPLRIRDAEALGLQQWSSRITFAFPSTRVGPETTLRPQQGPQLPAGIGTYNAAQTAEAVTGQWLKHPDVYARVTGALNDLGLIDKKISSQYRLGQAARQIVRRAQAIKVGPNGELAFDVDAFRKGLTVGSKALGELERRKVPDEAVRSMLVGRPTEPVKVKMPDFEKGVTKREVPKPAAVPEPEITRRRLPIAGHPFAMGALAEAPFAAVGNWHSGLPFAAGVLASEVLPKEIVTKAPLTRGQQFASRFAPAATGAAVKLSPSAYREIERRRQQEPAP